MLRPAADTRAGASRAGYNEGMPPSSASAQPLSSTLLAFLMVGRGASREAEISGQAPLSAGSLAFLRTMATDTEAATGSPKGLPPLAAWLSNRQGFLYNKRHLTATRDADDIEAIALDMLNHGADGCAGLDAWRAGRGRPNPEACAPIDCSREALLEGVTPCPLAAAFACGFVALTEAILDQALASRPGFLEEFDSLACANGEPLLHAATGNQAMLEMLLRKGVNPHVRGAHARTALHAADTLPAATALLNAGIDPETRDANGLACVQTWRRLPDSTARTDLVIKFSKSPQPVRDALFLGTMSGSIDVAETLRREGVAARPEDLVWTGIAARLCGLLGNRVLPSSRSMKWLEQAHLLDPHASRTWSRQFCLMGLAVLDSLDGAVFDSNAAHQAFGGLLSAVGWRDTEATTPEEAKTLLAAEHGNLPRNLVQHLDAMATAIANETGRPRVEVERRVFGTAGAALLSARGLDGSVASLLQACVARWPERHAAATFLMEWARATRSEDAAGHSASLDGAQAVMLARALSDTHLVTPGVFGTLDAWCEDTLPLWADLLAWEINAPASPAAAEVGSRLDAIAAKYESEFRSAHPDAFADLLVLRKATPAQRRLSALPARSRHRHRA